VARLHLEKIGVKLTTLTPEQADLGVDTSACRWKGPYKPEHYRYWVDCARRTA
jgi:adenosylhomocysteinase